MSEYAIRTYQIGDENELTSLLNRIQRQQMHSRSELFDWGEEIIVAR